MYVAAIVAAGGSGRRFGSTRPKQLIEVGGRTVLERSVRAFLDHPRVDEVVVALPADLASSPPAFLGGASKPLRVVAGGERRQDSVANAFAAIGPLADLIVIHDAARPLVDADLIDRTIAAAAASGAAIAAVPAHDTVKLAAETRRGYPRRGTHAGSHARLAGADAASVHAACAGRRPRAGTEGRDWNRRGGACGAGRTCGASRRGQSRET